MHVIRKFFNRNTLLNNSWWRQIPSTKKSWISCISVFVFQIASCRACGKQKTNKSNKLERVHSETHQDDSAEKKAYTNKNKNKKRDKHTFVFKIEQSSIDIIWWYLQKRLARKSAVGTTKLCQLKIMHNTVSKTSAL